MRLAGRRIVGQHGAATEGAHLEQRPRRSSARAAEAAMPKARMAGSMAAHGDARSATSSTFGGDRGPGGDRNADAGRARRVPRVA